MAILKMHSRFNLAIVAIFTLILVYTKWVLINYGLPYQVHVDEITILKEPFKLALEYSQGNFTHSSNLLNWLFLAYSGVVYLLGLLLGSWSGLEEFKTFIVSDSGSLLLIGRLFSLLLSVVGGLILVNLVFKMTQDWRFRGLFSLLILFNPIEWNSTNWVKFEGFSYLMYSIILTIAYDYFVLGKEDKRFWLYVAGFIGTALRIEIVAYLIGLFFYDFFFYKTGLPFFSRFIFYLKPFAIGGIIYCVITFVPLSWVYGLTHSGQALQDKTIYPTFEKAIVTKIPSFSLLINSILSSVQYLKILIALLGPVLMLGFVFSYKNKSIAFIYPPFLITACILIIFPVKNTHYLLNVSVLMMIGAFAFLTHLQNKKISIPLIIFSLAWTGSYSLFFFKSISSGDVRIEAREYLLRNTKPTDVILVEGIFSQIPDQPYRYKLRSEASKQIGSTGLSSSYLAATVNAVESRNIVQVTNYLPFQGTDYEDTFEIPYDSVKVKIKNPKYFVYVAQSPSAINFKDQARYQGIRSFFDFIDKSTTLERKFSYDFVDPRLTYSNFYYFHPVLIYKFRPVD